MKAHQEIKIITPETSAEEVISLSLLSDPSDQDNYRKIMLAFITNSLSDNPDLDLGVVYCLYAGDELLAATRIKQDDYTFAAVSIEYFAVKPEYQGKGFGKLFLQGLFQEIEKRWNKKYVILATTDSRGFYEKSGMSLLGELPTDSGHPRFYMYKQLGCS